jgi:hypothetical protein
MTVASIDDRCYDLTAILTEAVTPLTFLEARAFLQLRVRGEGE